jgi:hypothetical protein
LTERVEAPEAYCEAWPLLRSAPWQHIDVYKGLVTPHVLDCIGQATHITRLRLECHRTSTATQSGLAAALAPLKLLKSLDVNWPERSEWERAAVGDFASASVMASCGRALAGLTALTWLKLRNVPLQRGAAVDIASLQQLNNLDLRRCQLGDYAVNVFALRLTGMYRSVFCLRFAWV